MGSRNDSRSRSRSRSQLRDSGKKVHENEKKSKKDKKAEKKAKKEAKKEAKKVKKALKKEKKKQKKAKKAKSSSSSSCSDLDVDALLGADGLLVPNMPDTTATTSKAYQRAFGLCDAAFSLTQHEDDVRRQREIKVAEQLQREHDRKNENIADDWYCDKCGGRNFRQRLECHSCGRDRKLVELSSQAKSMMIAKGAKSIRQS